MSEILRGFKIRGLRARVLGVVLLAVVLLVGLLFTYAGIQNQAAQARARTDVQRSLQADVRGLEDLVAESRATLVTFGITYAIQARNWQLAQGNAVRLKAEHPEYALVAVGDPSGRIIVSSNGTTGTVSIAASDFFKTAVRTHRLTVSAYQTDPVLKHPTINVSYPVYGPKGDLIAVEYIARDPEQLRSRLTAGGPGLVETLVDPAGTIVLRRPPLPGIEGKKLTESALVRAMLSQHEGEITTRGLDGVVREYFFSFFPRVAEGRLYLTVGYSPETLLAEQNRTLWLTLGGFAVFALIALVVAWFVGTYSIYRPARALEQAAMRLSGGDLSARADIVESDDEFGALGAEFNHMADAVERQVAVLERTRAELRVLNTELEDRVRRRTAELEASNKELEAFSYSVSHDLRSPLRAIDGFSQALLEDYSDKLDDEGRDHLRRVREAASRMGRLIDSLLALSRLSRQEMRVHDVDLSAVAAEVADSLRDADPERDVQVTIQEGVHGQGDPTLLQNVLENLLANAWKFTGKHATAHIEFGSEEVGGEAVYFVRDDGAGFDMAYADKLFGAFQRIHGQAEFPGVGVGLATTARIVRRHGGRIWAQGELEKGATFRFTLC